jgi:multimeric flavodoxin WrbA
MQEEHNTKRKYLLISTLPKDTTVFETVHNELSQYVSQLQTISTNGMKISHCIGCNDCWIKTPGLCCIKDDYEQILIKMLQVDCVIFLTETKLGFVCSQMKNLVDRILPLATMHLKLEDGQMRHYSRYKKQPDMALLYAASPEYYSKRFILLHTILSPLNKLFFAIFFKKNGCRGSLTAQPYKKMCY